MNLHDAGLAHEHWKRYYTPDEVEEVLANTRTTMIVSGGLPVHVRLWEQPQSAPTVVIGSSILSYGLHLVRLQAPLFRAGFNVMQFDFVGLGQSGGPRGGCTVGDFLRCWRDALAFAQLRFGEPLYVMGVGEDGVTGYYIAANKPHVRAISVHNLFEYGEPDAVQGQGPYWMVRAKAAALKLACSVRPTTEMPGSQAVPWEWIFGGPGDDDGIRLLQEDPLSLRTIQLRMLSSILEKRPAPVPFEDCRTPVQVIASDRNLVCPYPLVLRSYQRLGGPKELITLPGRPQWELNREFHEEYCTHVVRWFEAHGAELRASTRMSMP
jgi:alpha-beta hydrolase superfamily lysophospholipase